MVTFEKFSTPQRVQTSGKDVILAYGSGKINIGERVDATRTPAILNDVWYVSEARHQLFSIRQVVQPGNTATFNDKGVEIRQQGKLVATRKLVGPVYMMDIRVSAPDPFGESNLAATEEALQGWHERLGHQANVMCAMCYPVSVYGLSVHTPPFSVMVAYSVSCIVNRSTRVEIVQKLSLNSLTPIRSMVSDMWFLKTTFLDFYAYFS